MGGNAVLFDFDGTLADTENHHVAAWQRTLAALGWLVPDEAAARSCELDDRVFLGELFERRGLPPDRLDDWISRERTLAAQLLEASPRLYPGALALALALKKYDPARPLGLVSRSGRSAVAAVLGPNGLADAFDVVIAAEDVVAGPPAPDGFALALERLARPAEAAWALVGSQPAFEAARSAGMRVLAVGHRRAFGAWAGAAPYLSGLEPVESVLEQLKVQR